MGSSLAQLVECQTRSQEDEGLFWMLFENVLLSKHSMFWHWNKEIFFIILSYLVAWLFVGQKVNIFNSAFIFFWKS